jgi:hypothetical protein
MVFKLAICELHIPDLHNYMGFDDDEIFSHYMVTSIINPEDFYNDDYKDDIAILKECYTMWLYQPHRNEGTMILGDDISHPLIRNYRAIIDNGNYIKLDIVNVDNYGDADFVATIKTFWLRLIQRKWKRIYKERRHFIMERIRFGSLRQREITGKWRNDTKTIPSYSF